MGIGAAASPTPVGARADLRAAPSRARRKDATLSPHHTDSQGMDLNGREGGKFLFGTEEGWEGESRYFVLFHFGVLQDSVSKAPGVRCWISSFLECGTGLREGGRGGTHSP